MTTAEQNRKGNNIPTIKEENLNIVRAKIIVIFLHKVCSLLLSDLIKKNTLQATSKVARDHLQLPG